jgi:hypothetical protein
LAQSSPPLSRRDLEITNCGIIELEFALGCRERLRRLWSPFVSGFDIYCVLFRTNLALALSPYRVLSAVPLWVFGSFIRAISGNDVCMTDEDAIELMQPPRFLSTDSDCR